MGAGGRAGQGRAGWEEALVGVGAGQGASLVGGDGSLPHRRPQ